MSERSQQILLSAMRDGAKAALEMAEGYATLEGARGAALAAEWLAERGQPYGSLRGEALCGFTPWMRTLGPIAVSQHRPAGTSGVWLPPRYLDEQWGWWRALHCLQICARLWPEELGLHLTKVFPREQPGTRLVWVRSEHSCGLAEIVWSVAMME